MSLFVVLMIGAAACGGGATHEVAENILEQQPGVQNVEVDDTSISMSFESEEGDISMEMGTGDLPDGFPFPIPDGCDVVGSSRWEGPDGVAMQAGLEFPPAEFDAIVGFYEAFLEDEGFDITKTVTGTDTDTMVMLLAEGPEATASVVASSYEGGASANLNWGPPASSS
jgi:hypothetical protein